MEKENQRIVITKRMLKESMLRLLNEKELDKINVTELCREAGINRATFYRHYEIPRDVLIEIEKDLYYDLRRTVRIPHSQKEIEETIELVCNYLEQHMDLLRTIIQNNTDTDFVVFINSIYEEIWCEIGSTGTLDRLTDEDRKLLMLYSAGGSYFILRHWLMGNIHKSAKQIASYMYEILNKTDWGMLGSTMGLISK